MTKKFIVPWALVVFLFLPLEISAQESGSENSSNQQASVTYDQNPNDPEENKTQQERKTIKKTKEKYIPPLSGIVLTPTAYDSKGAEQIVPVLDINLAYYIGRIYGRNTYNWTSEEKKYLDRIGLWILGLDGKLIVQTETKWRPAMAAGVQGAFIFRDSPDPQLDEDDPDSSVDSDKSDTIASAFVVFTKKIKKRFILNVGYSQGTFGNFIPQLSEFLTPEAIELSGKTGNAKSTGFIFGGIIFLLKPDYPISGEILVPQNATLNPKLINFRFGKLAKMSFQLSYLFYEGGWDLLGCIQFRFNMFPG